MPTLYILCGPSGCGKTTWAFNFISKYPDEDIMYVSRDEIRFSLLRDDEDYFAHEKEVFTKFVSQIVENLQNGHDVMADATHLNTFSRQRLTKAIDSFYKDYFITYIYFNIPLQTCYIQNELREGRARVPREVIDRMYRTLTKPKLTEDERATNVIQVGIDNEDYSYLTNPYENGVNANE